MSLPLTSWRATRVAALALTACLAMAAHADPLKVGFVYIGPAPVKAPA